MLFQGYRVAPGAFPDVVRTMPAHMFEIARSSAPTANGSGWHIAHILDVGDRRTHFSAWTRPDVIGRFVRSVHPCNYVLLPHIDWQRWGADQRVIRICARLYMDRYSDVWDDFIRLSGAIGVLPEPPVEPIVYSFGTDSARPAVIRGLGETPLRGEVAVEYKASRLAFRRDLIEPLDDASAFRVVTPVGTFQLTKGAFYAAFPGVVRSVSYRERGVYHYPKVPRTAERFRV